jgi:hypothetical protein
MLHVYPQYCPYLLRPPTDWFPQSAPESDPTDRFIRPMEWPEVESYMESLAVLSPDIGRLESMELRAVLSSLLFLVVGIPVHKVGRRE